MCGVGWGGVVCVRGREKERQKMRVMQKERREKAREKGCYIERERERERERDVPNRERFSCIEELFLFFSSSDGSLIKKTGSSSEVEVTERDEGLSLHRPRLTSIL